MCNWSVENGYYAKGSGSYHSLIPNCSKAFGLNVEGLGNDKAKVVDTLNNGKLVVALMSKRNIYKQWTLYRIKRNNK